MSGFDLNPPQKEAVTTLSGPLLVLAGAGTGKTRVITYRIAALIRSGIAADRILAVTFTNKAAREMKERALSLLGKRRRDGAKAPEICTFHSWCVRVLRRHITRLGYPSQFSIYDRGDQESLARGALRDVRVSQQKLKPSDLLSLIGTWKNAAFLPDKALENAGNDREQLAAMAYARYQGSLKTAGAVDFDDLLLLTQKLLTEDPEVRFAEASRFDHLLIDEYQDTNGLQYLAARAIAERHRNICVVGDDDQSIYAWRGAEVAHILNFQKDWPEAKVVRLEDNYRSRAPILELANTLIARNTERHKKVLRAYRHGGPAPRFLRFDDETTEAVAVVREIRNHIDPENSERLFASDFAILFRTNEQPRVFEMELRKAKVPYRLIGGQSFYDRKEIKDLLSYLRVLANPRDEVSLLRIINTPPRGISNGTVQSLMEIAVREGRPLWDILPNSEGDHLAPPHIAQRVNGFCKIVSDFRARLSAEPIADLLRDLLSTVNYRAELERTYKTPSDIEARWQTLEELANAAARYDATAGASASLQGFLEEIALNDRDDSRDSKKDAQAHAVTLMTLHSAKGLEFPHVYMVGMEEGLLPHKRSVSDGGHAIAEERRLCYVGVTRARDTLTLTLSKNRMKWGRLQPSIPSRFLLEMRGEFERAAAAAVASAQALASGGHPAKAAAKPDPMHKGTKKEPRKPDLVRIRRSGVVRKDPGQ